MKITYSNLINFIQENVSVKLTNEIIDNLKDELLEIKNGNCEEYYLDDKLFLIDRFIEVGEDSEVEKNRYAISLVE